MKDNDASQRTIKYFNVRHYISQINPLMIVESKIL